MVMPPTTSSYLERSYLKSRLDLTKDIMGQRKVGVVVVAEDRIL